MDLHQVDSLLSGIASPPYIHISTSQTGREAHTPHHKRHNKHIIELNGSLNGEVLSPSSCVSFFWRKKTHGESYQVGPYQS